MKPTRSMVDQSLGKLDEIVQRAMRQKHDPELPDYPAIVEFTIGPNGVAAALTNSAFKATKQDTLTRV
jgi:hypothetical protein